ncbi:MAG TPA: ATP-binding cassette domain-containing protein [Thermoplasmata archaeon]|nr:ATP-binding cassette domain-containing protein [Thermoplasmata archaeon]
MNEALGLDAVTVRYGERVALHSVSLRVPAGEVLALAGPNGSGKSTLLRAAAGLEPTAGGTVRLGGEGLSSLPFRRRAQHVGWMPQEEPTGDNLRTLDYVLYGRFPHVPPLATESAADRAAADRALALAGATELRDRRVWELSGGERQRVRLARVLAQEAPLLLLDEPTSHLDIGHQLDVLERVRAIARGAKVGVVLALHDLNLAARFADRIVVLHRGRIVADGRPPEVLSSRLLLEVWGIASELRYDERTRLPYLIPRSVGAPPPVPPPAPGGRPRVHVMAGGGSGAQLLRLLVERGFAVTAGALPLFDSDTEVAEELRVPSALEVPFAPISSATREQVRAFLADADAVVVAPFPVGPSNLANLEELRALPRPIGVVLLRHPVGRPWDFTDGVATTIRAELLARGATEAETVDDVERLLGRPASA